MDKIFTNPVRILIDQNPVARCEAIRNIYFDSIHANARYFNHIQGREENPIGKIVFSNCTFQKIAPERLEIDADTVPNKFCTGGILYADDIVYNNTSFRSEV